MEFHASGLYTQNGEVCLGLKFFDETLVKHVVYVQVYDLDSMGVGFFPQRIPSPNAVSWVIMLSAYARRGRIVEAQSLFNQMPERNVIAWNAMITGCV